MSKDIDIEKYTSEDITTEKLSELIAKKASFQIVAVKNISSGNKVEGAIEKKIRCRVYTEYRAAFSKFRDPNRAYVAGFASVIGIAAHNLATFNPDYEIERTNPLRSDRHIQKGLAD